MKFLMLLMLCASCGSVQTINGVRVKDNRQQPNAKAYIVSGVIGAGFGYYLGTEVLTIKK